MSLVKIRAALEAQFNSVAVILPAVEISSIAVGSTAVFTTSTPHGLTSGLIVSLPGLVNNTPALDKTYVIVVTSTTTFTLKNSTTQSPIGVTIAGNGGSVLANLTVWPNQSWGGPINVPYHKIDFIRADPDEPTQGGGYRKEQGIFQITLVYPLGVGEGAVTNRAELIRASFTKGLSFSFGGVTVRIPRTPSVGQGYATADSWNVPVKIRYEADIFS